MPCLLNFKNPIINTTTNTILKRSLSAPLLSPTSESSTSSSSESNSNRVDLLDYVITTNILPTTKPLLQTRYKLLEILTTHIGPVSSLALCGEFILSASQGKDIIVWQQPDLRLFTKFGSGEGSVKALVTVGNKVFTAHQDSRIRVWKVSRNSENVFRLVHTLPTTKDYLGKFMKQSNYVEIRRHHKKLWIEHADSISCLAVSKGLVYSGSWDKSLKVWRIRDFKCLLSVNKAHDDAINGLVVGFDGLLYSASADGKIKVWEIYKTQKQIHFLKNGFVQEQSDTGSHSLKTKATLEGHKDVSMNAVIIDNKDGTVFGGGSDGWLMGWRRLKKVEEGLDEWKKVVEMKAHQMAVLCLCFMGENLMCSGSTDKSICIWRKDYNNIVKVGVIEGHQGPVKCLQASPNCVGIGGGYLLYSGSLDKSLRVWWVSKEIRDNDDQSD